MPCIKLNKASKTKILSETAFHKIGTTDEKALPLVTTNRAIWKQDYLKDD